MNFSQFHEKLLKQKLLKFLKHQTLFTKILKSYKMFLSFKIF